MESNNAHSRLVSSLLGAIGARNELDRRLLAYDIAYCFALYQRLNYMGGGGPSEGDSRKRLEGGNEVVIFILEKLPFYATLPFVSDFATDLFRIAGDRKVDDHLARAVATVLGEITD